MNYKGRESDSLQEALDHGPLSCNIIEPLIFTTKCQGSIESSLSRIHLTRLKPVVAELMRADFKIDCQTRSKSSL